MGGSNPVMETNTIDADIVTILALANQFASDMGSPPMAASVSGRTTKPVPVLCRGRPARTVQGVHRGRVAHPDGFAPHPRVGVTCRARIRHRVRPVTPVGRDGPGRPVRLGGRDGVAGVHDGRPGRGRPAGTGRPARLGVRLTDAVRRNDVWHDLATASSPPGLVDGESPRSQARGRY